MWTYPVGLNDTLAGFAAIVMGGVAAGLGGIAGAPGTIPTAEIADDAPLRTGGGETNIVLPTVTPTAPRALPTATP